MAVSGAALRGGETLRGGDILRGGDTLERQQPIELAAASSLHLMHTASARQWTLFGPARLLACAGGAEEIVLARGTLRSEPGTGVRPGAEVWVATPFGSLRYSDARARVRVSPDVLGVEISGGRVWFSPLGGEEQAERELKGGTQTFAARPYRLASSAASARCEGAAGASAALAQALLAPSAEPLGVRAREHVRSRQRAHALCSSALATLLARDTGAGARAAPDELSQAGYSALARHDRLWRGVPELSTPP